MSVSMGIGYKYLIFSKQQKKNKVFTAIVRVCMKCDAPSFTPTDYNYIMQCQDIKPRYKILNDLTDKYKTSTKRIYQIWRGEETNRVLWDQPILRSYDDSNQNSNVSNSG
ncbi:1214_t:CDS:2, partial [Diversispora eburnea]